MLQHTGVQIFDTHTDTRIYRGVLYYRIPFFLSLTFLLSSLFLSSRIDSPLTIRSRPLARAFADWYLSSSLTHPRSLPLTLVHLPSSVFYGVVSESLPLSLPDVAGTDDVGAHHVDVAAVIPAHLARRYHPDTTNVNAIAGVIAYATIKSDSPRRDGNILTTISLRPFALLSLRHASADASTCRKYG